MRRVSERQRRGKGNRRTLCLAAALYLCGALGAAAPLSAQQAAPATQRALDIDNGAAVLMYHRFGEDSLPSTSVRLEQFEAHLAELTSGKYQVLALPEILARLRAAGYDKPFTELEEGVARYVKDYLSQPDPYR